MRQQARRSSFRKTLAGKLAAWAPLAFLCLAATPPLVAQSPEHERYYSSFQARTAAGEDLQNVIAEIEASVHDVLPEPIPVCQAIPPGGFPGVTSQRFYYLSEILPPGIGNEDPACGAWLGCFLDQVAGTVHDVATLVIDRQCTSRRTLVIPDRFVLAGVGLDGEGRLVFELPESARALRFKPLGVSGPIRHSQIRDLSIGTKSCCGQSGIDLSQSHLVNIENVRLSGFAFGITGRSSAFNTIAGSNLSNNGFGIVLGPGTKAWQMRENAISLSGLAGISFDVSTQASVVSGGFLERNPVRAIFLRGAGNVVQSTWFDGNGTLNGNVAIEVTGVQKSRILTNTFKNNGILNLNPNTSRCYNTSVAGPLLADNCP